MTATTTKSTKPRNGLWFWVGLAFGLMLAAWAALFVIAAHNKVEEVPLQTQPKATL
jgi:uncharacterized protein involved in exopolysaccharide biosynthesis